MANIQGGWYQNPGAMNYNPRLSHLIIILFLITVYERGVLAHGGGGGEMGWRSLLYSFCPLPLPLLLMLCASDTGQGRGTGAALATSRSQVQHTTRFEIVPLRCWCQDFSRSNELFRVLFFNVSYLLIFSEFPIVWLASKMSG